MENTTQVELLAAFTETVQATPGPDEPVYEPLCSPMDQDRLLTWFLVSGLTYALHPDAAVGHVYLPVLNSRKDRLVRQGVFFFSTSVPPTELQTVLIQAREASDQAELLQVFRDNVGLNFEGRCIVGSSQAALIQEKVKEQQEHGEGIFKSEVNDFMAAVGLFGGRMGDFGTLQTKWAAIKDEFDFVEPESLSQVETFISGSSASEAAYVDTLRTLLAHWPLESPDDNILPLTTKTLRDELLRLTHLVHPLVYLAPFSPLPWPEIPVLLPLTTNGQDARLFVYTLLRLWRLERSPYPALAFDRLLADLKSVVPAPSSCSPFDLDASWGVARLFSFAVAQPGGLLEEKTSAEGAASPGEETLLARAQLEQTLTRGDLLSEQRHFLEALLAAPGTTMAQQEVVRQRLASMSADVGEFDFGPCMLTGPKPSGLEADLECRKVLFSERMVLENDPARALFVAQSPALDSEFSAAPSLDVHGRLLQLEQFARYSFSEFVTLVNRQRRRAKELGQGIFGSKALAPVVVNSAQGAYVLRLLREWVANNGHAGVPSREEELAQLLAVPFAACTSDRDEFASMLATQLFALVLQAGADRFDSSWGSLVLKHLKEFRQVLPPDTTGFFNRAASATTPAQLFAVVETEADFPVWTPCQ
jgi:hypothetical protein